MKVGASTWVGIAMVMLTACGSPVAHAAPQAGIQDSNAQVQLSVISKAEAAIVRSIPESVKSMFARFDGQRTSAARAYREHSDLSAWYALLAFFFGHAYIFYGALILLVFLLLRLILLRLNVVA